jgi:hypothetical protein
MCHVQYIKLISVIYWKNSCSFEILLSYAEQSTGALSLPATRFIPVSWLAYSSTLLMVVTYSSETSVDFQRTTRCYIPK